VLVYYSMVFRGLNKNYVVQFLVFGDELGGAAVCRIDAVTMRFIVLCATRPVPARANWQVRACRSAGSVSFPAGCTNMKFTDTTT
jgi:hypothetical protein